MWHLFVLCAILFGASYSSKTSENNGTVGANIDGSGLINLGRKLHKPMLTLVGMAIQNLHHCGEWTLWTPCDTTRRGYFGSQTQNRSCIDPDATDVNAMIVELDKKLCEGFCSLDYNLTKNGFCIKLNTTTVTMDKAVEQCRLEGGYLIHIDSQRKYDDVKTVLGGFVPDIHIDGRRKDSASQWEYKYGSQQTFLNWHPSHPKNRADDLCLVFRPQKECQFDYKCSYLATILCEKISE